MAKKYKVEFEMVSAIVYPEYYKGDRPAVASSEVPDEHWHNVSREGEGGSVKVQYNGLLKLVESGELIRNVRLYSADVKPTEWHAE